MANRNLAPVRALVRELVPIVGSFAPNGASAVAASSRKGLGWSVARTGAGQFTITFTDKWPDLVCVSAGLGLATADDKFVQVGTYNATNKTLILTVWDISGLAATDVAADANNRISFTCWFRNSSVLPTKGA